MYHVGFSYAELQRLPVWKRMWFMERLNKEIKDANKRNGGGDTRAAHANNPEARQMMGRARAQVPAKLRRFT